MRWRRRARCHGPKHPGSASRSRERSSPPIDSGSSTAMSSQETSCCRTSASRNWPISGWRASRVRSRPRAGTSRRRCPTPRRRSSKARHRAVLPTSIRWHRRCMHSSPAPRRSPPATRSRWSRSTCASPRRPYPNWTSRRRRDRSSRRWPRRCRSSPRNARRRRRRSAACCRPSSRVRAFRSPSFRSTSRLLRRHPWPRRRGQWPAVRRASRNRRGRLARRGPRSPRRPPACS